MYDPSVLSDADLAFFKEIGYNPIIGVDFQTTMEIGYDDVWVKFMSNCGETDDTQGLQFAKYLKEKGYQYESNSPRSYMVKSKEFANFVCKLFSDVMDDRD